MTTLGLFLLLGSSAVEEAPLENLEPVTELPQEVREAMEASRDELLADRMTMVSEPLLGAVYQVDPLGEERPPDEGPLVRYDAFDCLTFVEEVLALSLASDVSELDRLRLAFRYSDGRPDYAARRHFMELQWIPDNVAAGRLVDTTYRYGTPIRLEQKITTATWHHWPGRQRFHLSDGELPLGTMQLDVLPLEEAIEAAHTFAPGSILMIARTNRPGVPVWITHLGFVTNASHPTFRHASRGTFQEVRDQDLRGYLNHLLTYENWPVAGVAVFEPFDAPR